LASSRCCRLRGYVRNDLCASTARPSRPGSPGNLHEPGSPSMRSLAGGLRKLAFRRICFGAWTNPRWGFTTGGAQGRVELSTFDGGQSKPLGARRQRRFTCQDDEAHVQAASRVGLLTFLRLSNQVLAVIGRGERIRTSDPLVPNQVLYQAEPLPEPSFAARKRIGNMRRATGQIDRAANSLECSRGSRIAVSLCGSPIKPPRIC
jgi:hypothetical protein